MKSVARTFCWWPGLDREIETQGKACTVCQAARNAAPVTPLQLWTWPERPWKRVHVDYAQRDQTHFLVLVDSHSKWVEVFETTSTTTQKTVEILRRLFAAYGLPEEPVSDNDPHFTSTVFESFCKSNGIKHTLVPPYHPVSNGVAERVVGILKQTLLRDIGLEQWRTVNLVIAPCV